MVPELAIVELKMRNWSAALEWFRDVFGLPVQLVDEDNQYALLGAQGNTRLSIMGTTRDLAGDRVLLQWQVNGLSGLVESLRHKGVIILKDVSATKEHYRDASIEGPEGLRLLLFEYDAA